MSKLVTSRVRMDDGRLTRNRIMSRNILIDNHADALGMIVRQATYHLSQMRDGLEECLKDENIEGWVISLFDCGEVESMKTREITDPVELYEVTSRWYAVLESCFESRTYSRWLRSTKQVFDEDIMFFTGEIATGLEAILIILQSIDDNDTYQTVVDCLLDSGFLS